MFDNLWERLGRRVRRRPELDMEKGAATNAIENVDGREPTVGTCDLGHIRSFPTRLAHSDDRTVTLNPTGSQMPSRRIHGL